jgi:hypothetical protein
MMTTDLRPQGSNEYRGDVQRATCKRISILQPLMERNQAMKKLLILSAVAIGASGTALAQWIDPSMPASREEVKAEARRAQAAGEHHKLELGLPVEPFVSTKTRAEVRAETIAANVAGDIQRGESSISAAERQSQGAFRSRADVEAETRDAQGTGGLYNNSEVERQDSITDRTW